ncbi:MAG: molybdenum ABC transporter ATP-binding protein [Giesbergeria sp.]
MNPDSNGIEARLRLQRPTFTLDVDLKLPGRGFIALFGPSGCGKTSCLRALAGLERARPGVVRVAGSTWQDDAAGIWLPTHQRALGYVFQEASLFEHLSVRGNIEYAQKRVRPAQGRAIRAATVAVEQAVDLLGLTGLMERRPATLSGGERQRVAIARALAAQPRVLLMDEPLAALDAGRKAELLPYLEALQRTLAIPVLYVSHALDEVARLATHMVLLDAGRVRASGSAEDLIARLDLPLAQGDAAATIVEGTLLRHDSAEHLSTLAFSGGELHVTSTAARPVGQRLRVRIQARDVSLTLARQSGTSILNIVPATVTGLREDSPGQWMVALDAGGARLLARITQRSVHLLGIAPGRTLFAQVKGVALLD